MQLGQFLEAIRKTEERPYDMTGPTENNATPFGTYGILVENWEAWSSMAGLGGADRLDPDAQDFVAGFMANNLFRRYGSWDLVGAAWYAGQDAADAAATSGKGAKWFSTPEVQQWLTSYTENFEASANAPVPKAATKWINPAGSPKGWLMPVAGSSEWSRGSFMAKHTKGDRSHYAIDVYSKRGTPIVAPVGGKVLSTKVGKLGGNTVRMMGDDGLVYYFAHMDSAATVKQGERVKPGAHLGFVGNSGSAKGTKPHLHFSIKRNGVAVHPGNYLDGAKNAGNYYAPQDATHDVEQPAPVADKMNGLLQSVSNQVSGGDRVDYRELGLPEEPEERKITSDDKGMY